MGFIWRSTMPFLITMAALVLIVHTAEEDLETEYRHDLRPRILDTKTSDYDQTWRALEAEPAIQHTRNDKWDDTSLDELPKRRRPGRKRKRRPQASPSEDFGRQDRYPEEPPSPYYDDGYLTTEIPMRRRKKPDLRPIRWTDESVDLEVPLRRRNQRRKRPMLESWPELSEFNGFRPENTLHEKVQTHKDHNDKEHFEEGDNVHKETKKTITDNEPRKQPIKLFSKVYDGRGEDESQYKNKPTKEDESLSELSTEVISSEQRKNLDEDNLLINDPEITALNEHEKAEERDANPAITLKDILKKSNGTSLSEILQQHNLSLTDLLHGKENAVSIFKPVNERKVNDSNKTIKNMPEKKFAIIDDLNTNDSAEKELLNSETMQAVDEITTNATECPTTTEQTKETTAKVEHYTTMKLLEDSVPKIILRNPIGVRKKLRMRPMLNNTFKAQLSRDLVTLNSRKYSHHRRNTTKLRDWKEVFPLIKQNNNTSDDNAVILESEITTNTNIQDDETTTNIEFETDSNIELKLHTNHSSKLNDVNMGIIEVTPTSVTNKSIEISINSTDKLPVISMPRPTALSSGLRRQAFDNRLKRKRLKQKNATTEPPQDNIIKHLLGMGNLVSSSEFIARTQEPKDNDENNAEYTTLEDFITTESTSKSENYISHTTSSLLKKSTTPAPWVYTTTEETAKIEIEEILNDTQTSARLSKILMERNMTLNELVEHRERGSSHIHLADIFHNASREPNPPEPFLSKSVIEPISKETYPLRALLDANLHDTTAKPNIVDPIMIPINQVNIPVVMDFRNNVNENAENIGIISLFNNYTKSINKKTIKKDSEGRTYEASVTAVNNTYEHDPSNKARESRTFTENMDDVVSWNEIFSLMRRNHKTETGNFDHAEETTQVPYKQFSLDEDIDGDGMIVLEDLQHLKDFDINIAPSSDEKLEAGVYKKAELPPSEQDVHERIPSQTKSVTVATASIAGLAMVLFLITCTIYKWREQKANIHDKNSFCDERIPTPVFETRKGLKHNSSMRSISPMLQTSNIYTLNTLDSKGGKESPEYMWDTLRKPFQ